VQAQELEQERQRAKVKQALYTAKVSSVPNWEFSIALLLYV
jgi:hypothetical protein